MRRALFLAFLLPAAPALAQMWPNDTGPGGDMMRASSRQFDRLRQAAPTPSPMAAQPYAAQPYVAQPGPGAAAIPPGQAQIPLLDWAPPPLPAATARPAAPRRAAPRRASTPPASAPTPAAATQDWERTLNERERELETLRRRLEEDRRRFEAQRVTSRAPAMPQAAPQPQGSQPGAIPVPGVPGGGVPTPGPRQP